MKKLRLAALLLASVLLLAACAVENPSVPYDKGDCQHVFGYWYDIETVTCLAAGKQIRYCKLCRATQEQTVEVATEINDRNHAFFDTVVPPTEATGGYMTRVCTLCGHRVEKADPTPPLYALFADEQTVTAAPDGVAGVLLSDTVTRRLAYHAPLAVHAELARRLAVALTVTDRLSGEGLTLASTVTVEINGVVSPNVFYVGNVVTLEQTLRRWLTTGGSDAVTVLMQFLGADADQLLSMVDARLQKLGLENTHIEDLVATDHFGSTTLYDTAVLLCRGLAEESIATALSAAANTADVTIMGKTPVVWFSAATLRVSALREGETVRFLLLAGDSIANGAESDFFAT